jgi:NAD(P)-dependent dehydrogenase (short-subunit alcohol dehydrogenase family)
MGRLDGKVAIVTGGATGLGAAIVELYASEGARLVIGDIRNEEAEHTAEATRRAGGEAVAWTTDVSNNESVATLIEHAEHTFGRVDIVTSNAGVLGAGHKKSIVDVTESELRQILDVNFVGTWFTLYHAIPALLRAGGGTISITASTGAERGIPKAPAYAASKGAVVALMRSVAIDQAPQIRVNAVSPGAMATQMSVHAAEELGVSPSEVIAQAHAVEMADPFEAAHAHLYLVSDEATGVTGSVVTVDRGASARHP